jgi:hypothetical protein
MRYAEDDGPLEALLIPVDGPVQPVTLDDTLEQLQGIVGGLIQALPVPEFIDPDGRSTIYVGDESKFDPDCQPNMRATDFLVPGVGLFFGDYISGPMVVAGFEPRTGNHAPLPESVEQRVRLIEQEAGR